MPVMSFVIEEANLQKKAGFVENQFSFQLKGSMYFNSLIKLSAIPKNTVVNNYKCHP